MGSIIPYASRTGTKRNLDALRARGWRLLVSATGVLRTEGFPYALDNGAWTAYQSGREIDLVLFMIALWKLGAGADWVAAPDIVGGGMRSLELSVSWLRRILCLTERVLIPVQDGVDVSDVAPLLGPNVGVFVGGSPSTNWKEITAPAWAKACIDARAWCHVGRVNTQRRIHLCANAGVTSVDGTSASKFADSIPELQRAIAQPSFTFDFTTRK